jgi:hypothetical protein
MASAIRGSSPRCSATARNSARMAETIFSEALVPSPSTGVAAPMTAPGRMYTESAEIAISAPALNARGLTKAYTGMPAARIASEIRSAASTRPPGVSILR